MTLDEPVSDEVRRLLGGLPTVPAILTGRRGDVLAGNRLGRQLLFPHLPASSSRPGPTPNLAHHHFLSEHARSVVLDWAGKARDLVAHLRLLTGRHPGDRRLLDLIDELTVRSAEFARLWSDQVVGACRTASYTLRHPLVGPVQVEQQTVLPVGSPDQLLTLFVPRTPESADRLQRLAADRHGV